MKIFFDLLPIILFFASYKWAGSHAEQAAQWLNHYLGFAVSGGSVGVTEAPVLLATVVVVVATMLQILVLKALGKRVDKMLWAGLAVVVVLGGLTLWFHDETFIKWKPTVIYWLMSAGFLITEIVLGKKMLRQMMGGQVDVPEAVWRNLGWAWVLFFAGMGVLNLWVAFNFPTDTWVSFKMWGSLGLTLVFTLAQGVYLSRHMTEDVKDAA
ncbi:MAG: septation protein A [Burkholderiales bacterium RIFCSPLOWO2_12_FULL_64_99]|jgi:intracellular septation protein|uniref:septation protein A n=1 Tax=Aquabacterium sp. TaxID=1872578 RepID=UPI0008D52BCD|nr:septation protein A [Aquabacterium sp.]OGB05158.1 MAG: septation protein A [Burkholderiales bacterium RIFCSPHIGHO2_12_FULL_63_20]OGB60729.1 MAG: septation protein A [Burkholderiales bacterium RIFCSPLOWO2_12_FULL_64_99]